MSGSTDRVSMARGLALLFGAGATLVAITLLLPHGGDEGEWLLIVPCLLAWPTAAVLFGFPQRFSPQAISLVLAFGTALIGLCVVWGEDAGGIYALMYVWVAFYAAAFFSLRVVVAHVAWTVGSFAVLLAFLDVSPPSGLWLMTAGTSAVAATLIFTLTRELRARASDLVAVTRHANEIGSASEVSGAEVADGICAGVLHSTGAASAVLLEELADGTGLHVLGAAGDPETAASFERPAGVLVLDEAYRSQRAAMLRTGDGISGVVEPVRREGRVRGLLVVVWAKPRRSLTARVQESVALFAAEAGVALERIAGQSRDSQRRALELNDAIVQGLVVAKYALHEGRVEMGEEALEATLGRARALVDSQLQDLHGAGAPEPGSLRVVGPDAASSG
jgi:GAF domain-containing protein